MDKRNIKLANIILNNSISIKEGDNLLVEAIGNDSIALASEIVNQAENQKVRVTFKIIKYNELRKFLINSDDKDIIDYGRNEYKQMKKMNAYIGVSSPTSDNIFKGVPQNKIDMYNKYYISPVHLKQRVNHTKWCILRYPNKYIALKNNMNLREYKNFYYNVCNIDYNKMKIAMEPLKSLMNKTDKVHIIAPGTDLTFSIKGITSEKYYGTFNIPDGEVATCPVRDSINGYITYNTKTKYNNIIFENIRFEFNNGKIINATAKEYTKELNSILDTDEGARYIGEFAFGLNPYIDKDTCDVLFDEKINGSFHLTPGTALEASDNGNKSSIHWDIVKILKKEYGGGKIYFDNVLIMKDGKFVLEELKKLNPEYLK